MFSPLRLGARGLAGLGLLLALPGRAQCPVAAGCTPGKASSALAAAYNMGIYSVSLGSLTNASGGYADGYRDYSCTPGLAAPVLPVSVPATISVKNGAAPENVRVWIDYNNNGAFGSDELVFSSDNKTLHAGSITPPATAPLGVPLRVRVAADYASGAVPTACSTPEFSQTEDYAVILAANTSKPAAAFVADAATTCSGQVQFSDRSTGGPTGWSWDFGDGTSSSLQNPSHLYAAAGTYQVKLTASNAAGSSVSAATAITYNPAVPVAAACPGLAATANCCNYGIVRVRLGTLDNASADGSAGYQDFSCPQRTNLTVGRTYSLIINTGGTNPHATRAWLDYNNDGAFAASELLGEALSASNPSFSLTVPAAAAVLGRPLRLRLVADGTDTNPQPCKAPTLGQVEDYTVTLVPNTSPPTAAFTSNYVAGACPSPAGTYTLTDQSTDAPTSWRWSFSPNAGVTFVGGTSAASASPQVAFSTPGYYSVTLTVTNANGSNTLTRPNYLLVQLPCRTYCAASGGYGSGSASSFWITSVLVSGVPGATGFNNGTANAAGGYAFYATPSINLTAGTTQPTSQTITITTNQPFSHRTDVWVDYNRDGVFSNTTGASGELLSTFSNTATASFTLAIPPGQGSTRLRVGVALNANLPNPCAVNQGEAEVEDYLINAAQPLATRLAQALPALTVSPNPSPDGQLQVQLSDPAASGRYELAVDNLLGARLLAQTLRLSPAQPAALDLRALPAGVYLLRLTNAQGETALRRVVRE